MIINSNKIEKDVKSLMTLCKNLGININSIEVSDDINEQQYKEFSAQELLEMQGERQTYIDLEIERTGKQPIFYPKDEYGV